MYIVYNLFRSVGELQCGDGFREVKESRSHTCNHDGTRVPPKRVLEEPGQLGVSIWNVGSEIIIFN